MFPFGSVEPTDTRIAVHGHGIYFYFDRKRKSPVLSGLNIAVNRGEIYSLLGPSGCGKTTLLKCIIGQHKLQEGSLKIYGRVPGSKGFFIPGPGVGYMPQEMALYSDMTIGETLSYFGSLCQMNRQQIKERIPFLIELLELPDKNILIKHLSCGQKRRVSCAAAIVHKPPLLVLDEPTVGVDPLLRQAIWDHLVVLAKKEQLTIIITTHYIEEARQAHTVGLMRAGYLLAERNPEELIKQYGVITLEDVFLRLCRNKRCEDGCPETSTCGSTSIESVSTSYSAQNNVVWLPNIASEQYTDGVQVHQSFENGGNQCDGIFDDRNKVLSTHSLPEKVANAPSLSPFAASWMRFLCLTSKNFLRVKRNILFVIIQMFVPTIQILIFCLCVGADPFELPVAVANMEDEHDGFGKSFLLSLNNRTIHQREFHNLSTALQSVENGESWAAIYMDTDFSTCLLQRFLDGEDVTNETIQCSNINLYLDMSDKQIANTIYTTMIKSFQNFSSDLLAKFGKNVLLAESPLRVRDPVYGSTETSFTEFMAPGMILGITYLMALTLTSLSIILEKRQGLLERAFVAGATATEVLLSLFFTLLLVLFIQIIPELTCAFLIFNIPCNGPFVWVLISIILVGVGGMSFGLFVSSICDDESVSVMISMSTFYPSLLISGIIWPLEAMPLYLRHFSKCLPLTLIAHSMRCILTRGWNITDHHIWDGYLVSIGWTVVFMSLSKILLKMRK